MELYIFLVEKGDKSKQRNKQINMIWRVVSVVKIKELRSSDPRMVIFLCSHPSSSLPERGAHQRKGGGGGAWCPVGTSGCKWERLNLGKRIFRE